MFEAGETNILQAALHLKDKLVCDHMTRMDQTFMLEQRTVLDRKVLSDIYKAGFSRIPVFDKDSDRGDRIIGILMVKDLILLNPDRDHLALEQLTQLMRQPLSLSPDTSCLHALERFTQEKRHIAVI